MLSLCSINFSLPRPSLLGKASTLLYVSSLQLGGGRINTTGNATHPVQGHRTQGGGEGVACTSILALNRSGNVFHGRTLDWAIPANMRNLTIQVRG